MSFDIEIEPRLSRATPPPVARLPVGLNYRCGACKDSGAVQATSAVPSRSVVTTRVKGPNGFEEKTEEVEMYPVYAFACDCEIGRLKGYRFPLWRSFGGSSQWKIVP